MSTKYFLLVVAGAAMIFSGCGHSTTGTYNGTETISSPGLSPVSNASASLNISGDSNNSATGSFSDQSGNSNFTATISSDGTQLQNVSLSVPAPTTTSVVNGIPSAGCGGTYTGSLSLSNNTISGTLTLTSPTTTVPTTTTTGTTAPYTSVSGCQGATRAVSLTKSS